MDIILVKSAFQMDAETRRRLEHTKIKHSFFT